MSAQLKSVPPVSLVDGAQQAKPVVTARRWNMPLVAGFSRRTWIGAGVLAAALAVVVFGAVAYALDREDLQAAAGRLRRQLRGS